MLSASPAQVSITFTQDVQKVTGTYGIEVTSEAGDDVTAADAVVSDDNRNVMTVQLQPNLPQGRYIVQYKNVSDADGDPWAGGFAFYIGVEPTAEQLAADAQLEPEEEETPPPTQPAATSEPAGTPLASATAVPPNSGDDDDDGGGGTTWIILGAVIAVGIAAGFVGARMIAARRRA